MIEITAQSSALDRIDQIVNRACGVISGIAVLGLLAGAMVIVVDVTLRASGVGGVVALNEIMGQMFGMAVAATLPAGAARQVNLRVDLMAAQFGPKLTRALQVAGSVALLIFFAALTYYVIQLGMRFVSGNGPCHLGSSGQSLARRCYDTCKRRHLRGQGCLWSSPSHCFGFRSSVKSHSPPRRPCWGLRVRLLFLA